MSITKYLLYLLYLWFISHSMRKEGSAVLCEAVQGEFLLSSILISLISLILFMIYSKNRPGRVAQWSAHPLWCPRSWVRTRPHPRRTKRAFALCQFGGLNEAKTFFLMILRDNLFIINKKLINHLDNKVFILIKI